MGAHIAAGGAFPGDVQQLGPGDGIVQGAGIQVVHVNAALAQHILVVIESNRRFRGGDGIQTAVIGTLGNCGSREIGGVGEIAVQRDRDAIGGIVGHLGAIHKEDVGQIVGGDGGSDLVVIGVGVGAVDGLPGDLDVGVLAVPLVQLFHPPVFHRFTVGGLPDAQLHRAAGSAGAVSAAGIPAGAAAVVGAASAAAAARGQGQYQGQGQDQADDFFHDSFPPRIVCCLMRQHFDLHMERVPYSGF